MATMQLLPPKPGTCSCCAVDHSPLQAHNQDSLYWQYWFYGTHGRWPTWADAIAHCSEEMQKLWQTALTAAQAWSQPAEGLKPIACRPQDYKPEPTPIPVETSTITISTEESNENYDE